MDLGLSGRVVLVTGGSRGIGLACARAFAAEGARVSIAARDPVALAAAAATMPGALAVTADLTDAKAVAHMVAEVETQLATVDVLVMNAGGPPPGAFDVLADEDWARAVDLILMSAVRTTRAVLPAMRARGWGRIVVLSSYGVKQPVPNLTLSNSVRMAMLGWSKTLARQVATDGVTVNTVCPGWTRTHRVAAIAADRAAREGRTSDAVLADIAATIPMGRLGEPDEVARLALFLGSEAASYITGVAVAVDGGLVEGYA